ncbi:MAG: thiL [Thermoleophilia bacterium]|nr:thiL [Thermoleophilia bacterium]MCZ4496026.1 thiL [Thermoleophilia bacterium]
MEPARPPENERELLDGLLATAHVDNGDDAAPLRIPSGIACMSTDATVAGVHAPLATTPHALGRRAVARALSDLAAMGAAPVAVTVAQLVPAGRWDDAQAAAAGARELARERGCDVVGGDVCEIDRSAPASLIVTVVGTRTAGSPTTANRSFVQRDGARIGDVVLVTGLLGGSGVALRAGRYELPEPPDRLRAGQLLARHATSMIDVSDGIATDARHLADASGHGIGIDVAQLPLAPGVTDPVAAARDGDDYELLCTIPKHRVGAAQELLARHCSGLQLTPIGEVAHDVDGLLLHERGERLFAASGFVHGDAGT